jgi:CBS domain-containing protein
MATRQPNLSSALAHTIVADAMNPRVVMCGPETRLPMVAATMATHAIHTVVVPSRYGGAALTITDLDLLRAGLGGDLDQTAGDIAHEPFATFAPGDTLEQAVAAMATLDVSHLLVAGADPERPDGMLSSFDVVSVLAGRDPRLTRTIRPGPARPLVSATRLSGTTVGDVMHPGVITCLPSSQLREVAVRMADLRIHCIAVAGIGTRPDGDGHLLWGLVSHMDVIHAAQRGTLATPAGDVAATSPLALPEDATLEHAAQLMIGHNATHVVAVGRSGTPSGIVSSLDAIRILAAG